ncbi:hypothetical protein EJ03DRAFT_348426 [Teratosphaeria nubilosa]|uniref:Hamartin-domain-containing protein n=1 Tax=Teratosphaeria nubilosa TaxID=161662 RepID=A0A6G1LJ70_9PEZI|nr:hypothetical protein EJ03DRAFT_348426 [Teratosphaeria nubilosa]
MGTRSIKDATKALQGQFSSAKIPLSLPSESRRILQGFVEEHKQGIGDEEATRVNAAIDDLYETYVCDNPSKIGPFVGVLRELRPALGEADLLAWWEEVVRPVITGTGHRKPVLDDAQEFVVGCMVLDDDEANSHARGRASQRLLGDFLGTYIARTRGLTQEDLFIAPENSQVTHQIESVVVAFGRKRPKDLFNAIDDLITNAITRLQGLTLLSSFLRHQTPHLYLVMNTPLVEHLLRCLMNDLSTTVLAVALTSLIMLLPHIPGALAQHLPRLFLVYSRLLCWERFSTLSSKAEKKLVTDERLEADSDDGNAEIGIDPSWERTTPTDGVVETATPELLSYFTFLYGLYPLNFASYIRKPRRYLKNLDFPGAEDFDLDQAIIRRRTDQFRQVHLLHPNFYNLTPEEELIDPKWPKADPADVVAECQALCISTKHSLTSPGPPPSSRLPDLPPIPPLTPKRGSIPISPTNSHVSLKSGNSWRDTQSTAVSAQTVDGDSPVLRAQDDDGRPRSKASATNRISTNLDDFPQPSMFAGPRNLKEKDELPQNNLAFLQRENTLLKNELNFERWHKSQYSQHISQLTRKNVKDATAEAETLNLINANRALKQQLEQIRQARNATINDANLTRRQANSLEANLTERYNALRKEQEAWRADSEELQRLRSESTRYRDLLVATEQRELNQRHHLEIAKRDLEQMRKVNKQLREAQHKLREYEYREYEMGEAKRELEIVEHERDALQLRLQRQQHDLERTRRAYEDKIAELVAQQDPRESVSRKTNSSNGPAAEAIAESQAKLATLKRKHTALMEKYTDLEMEYESVKSQLELMRANHGNGHDIYHERADSEKYTCSSPTTRHIADAMSGALGGSADSAYDTSSDHTPTAVSENAYIISASEPRPSRFHAPLSLETRTESATTIKSLPPQQQDQTSMTCLVRQGSMASRGSGGHAFNFNSTAPISADEVQRASTKSTHSEGSHDTKQRREKVQPDSKVRVYGRGGAQNIKMKTKEQPGDLAGVDQPKKKGLKGFRLT